MSVPLMVVLGLLGLVGVTLALRWGAVPYRVWAGPEPRPARGRSDPAGRVGALRYGRGLAVAVVAGFWAGALVTGPAVRLIMRLLAVTGGDDAQGRLTEAEEVVGEIDLGGTLGLYLFGGILPGVSSGILYVLLQRWLPAGRAGGVSFGLLHLLVGATRLDPLRPDNPDFDIVGPGWLSVLTFSLACLLHGMAVAAFANRYSAAFPPRQRDRAALRLTLLPLALPALLFIPGAPLLIPIALALVVAVSLLAMEGLQRAVSSDAALVTGRVLLAILALALLPGTASDLYDVFRSAA